MNNTKSGSSRVPRYLPDAYLIIEALAPVVRRALCDADYDWHPAGWLTIDGKHRPVGDAIKAIREADCAEHARLAKRERRAIFSRYGAFAA